MKTALSITALMLPSAQAGLFDMFKWETCPQTQPLTDFDIDRYLGEWYEMYKRKDSRLQDGECTLATYSSSEYPNFIRVENSISRVNPDGSFAKRNGVQGWGKEYNPVKRDGKLGVKFSQFQPTYAPYHVLASDYETYTIVHSCSDGFLSGKTELTWILTREPLNFGDLPAEEQASYIEKFDKVLGTGACEKFFGDLRTAQGEQNGCDYTYTYTK